ncbi:MAG TPA: class IV adenylate cyclase [Candidatus Binataceae bacterium]|nr:class IV adenylate cyclase [Candidatus Binataceae bacterium]
MRNLEAKFRLDDLAEAGQRAEAIGFSFFGLLVQRDTFFAAAHGKLKLRDEADGSSLIHYHRDHDGKLEVSNYEIVMVPDPFKMRALLSAALEVIAEVRKTRKLFMRGNIRLHLDEVDNLGNFGEIEAVLDDGEDPGDYRAQVAAILAALRVSNDQLIEASYFELMRLQ